MTMGFKHVSELPGCRTSIPFTDLLDSVLQLVALEEDDKHRLVHIIPLEQKKGRAVTAQELQKPALEQISAEFCSSSPWDLQAQRSSPHRVEHVPSRHWGSHEGTSAENTPTGKTFPLSTLRDTLNRRTRDPLQRCSELFTSTYCTRLTAEQAKS